MDQLTKCQSFFSIMNNMACYNENNSRKKEMTYQELLTHLFSISDKKFASFSKSISNSSYEVIGVKNPALRAIIKEHKNDVELLTDDFVLGKYLEVDFIYFGLSLSREKNINSQLKFLKEKIHLAKSWIITDCSSSFLKKTSFDAFYDFFIDMYQRKNIYERRMAYVLALKQYKDERIKEILPLIKTKEEYMVYMAEAWLLSVIALTYEDDVFDYLAKTDDLVLMRKTISKICDSYRFDEESKNRFKELRTKNKK